MRSTNSFSFLSSQRGFTVGCLLLVFLSMLPGQLSASANPPLAVITHPSSEQSQILQKTLRAIFGMRLQRWADGNSVTVYVLKDTHELHRGFCHKILKMLPYHLRRNWDRLSFSGTGQAPIQVSSEEEMLTKVANTPGAIGYLSREHIDATVSVLHVDR